LYSTLTKFPEIYRYLGGVKSVESLRFSVHLFNMRLRACPCSASGVSRCHRNGQQFPNCGQGVEFNSKYLGHPCGCQSDFAGCYRGPGRAQPLRSQPTSISISKPHPWILGLTSLTFAYLVIRDFLVISPISSANWWGTNSTKSSFLFLTIYIPLRLFSFPVPASPVCMGPRFATRFDVDG